MVVNCKVHPLCKCRGLKWKVTNFLGVFFPPVSLEQQVSCHQWEHNWINDTWPNWIQHLHACCTGVDQMVQWMFSFTGCRRRDGHKCVTCGKKYQVEGWLHRHYRKLPTHDPGQSHLDEHSVTLMLNLLQLLFHALCVCVKDLLFGFPVVWIAKIYVYASLVSCLCRDWFCGLSWKITCVWEECWNVHFYTTKFDCPEVTMCTWQDIKINY